MRLIQSAALRTMLGVAAALGAQPAEVRLSNLKGPENASIIDYMKARPDRFTDWSLEARRALFAKKVSGTERFTGAADQNLRLLAKLVEEDSAAKESVAASEKHVQAVLDPQLKSAPIAGSAVCWGFTPAEGFGVHGTYALGLRAYPRNHQLRDRDFHVAVDSASFRLGTPSVTATVQIVRDGEADPNEKYRMVRAWFETLDRQGSTTQHLYLPKDTVINLAGSTLITARVTVHPIVKTTSGTVALIGCDAEIVLVDRDISKK